MQMKAPPSPSPSRVVSYADANRIVREHADGLAGHAPHSTSLLDALGRVLAEPVSADRDQPPFPRSTRDGFACRAADIGAAKPLRIIGQLKAGDVWKGVPLASGQAIEIMTGAPVPAGADCVVMIEHVKVRDDVLFIDPGRTLEPGENIVP